MAHVAALKPRGMRFSNQCSGRLNLRRMGRFISPMIILVVKGERIGLGYDLKNIIDLMRYLFPWPVTQRRRRRMIMLGSGGDATMSYDLRVRSQAHYLLARSVVDFWTDTGFPISLKCLRRTPQSRFRGISSAVCDFFVSMA